LLAETLSGYTGQSAAVTKFTSMAMIFLAVTLKYSVLRVFPRQIPTRFFSAGADGVPRHMNYATSQLIQDLELENTLDILPRNHKELVNACLNTSEPLIRERKVAGRTIIWSYHPIDDSDLIYIYGHDVTGYHANIF
jgi:hypothetical protein